MRARWRACTPLAPKTAGCGYFTECRKWLGGGGNTKSPDKTDADDAPLTKLKTQVDEKILFRSKVSTKDGTAIIAQICSHWDANLFAESGLYPITYFFLSK